MSKSIVYDSHDIEKMRETQYCIRYNNINNTIETVNNGTVLDTTISTVHKKQSIRVLYKINDIDNAFDTVNNGILSGTTTSTVHQTQSIRVL